LAAADESQLPIKVGDWIFIVNNNSNLLASMSPIKHDFTRVII
jgi:hypothetical protein